MIPLNVSGIALLYVRDFKGIKIVSLPTAATWCSSLCGICTTTTCSALSPSKPISNKDIGKASTKACCPESPQIWCWLPKFSSQLSIKHLRLLQNRETGKSLGQISSKNCKSFFFRDFTFPISIAVMNTTTTYKPSKYLCLWIPFRMAIDINRTQQIITSGK